MERTNDFTGAGSGAGGTSGGFGGSGDQSSSTNYGAGAGNVGGSTSGTGGFGTTGSTGGSSGSTSDAGASVKDKARDLAGNAKEKLADVGSTVSERASSAKDKLADAIESGADKLRQRSAVAGATATGGAIALEGDGRTTQVTDRVATGMQATADWIRDADLENLRLGLERQVKEHPGRTLLLAVGVGYLVGKAFRK
jgi:hypothetical protein